MQQDIKITLAYICRIKVFTFSQMNLENLQIHSLVGLSCEETTLASVNKC